MNTPYNAVTAAIQHLGPTVISKRAGVSAPAVLRWKREGRLPTTDLSGLTNHAGAIAELCSARWSRDELIATTRNAWIHARSLQRSGSAGRARSSIAARRRSTDLTPPGSTEV